MLVAFGSVVTVLDDKLPSEGDTGSWIRMRSFVKMLYDYIDKICACNELL